jgi:hypothetical protein
MVVVVVMEVLLITEVQEVLVEVLVIMMVHLELG